MRESDNDRYRGDGSADREALSRHAEDEASPRAPMPSAEDVERRNAEILREMQQRTIDGFRGGDSIRAALLAAAAIDGIQLEKR